MDLNPYLFSINKQANKKSSKQLYKHLMEHNDIINN